MTTRYRIGLIHIVTKGIVQDHFACIFIDIVIHIAFRLIELVVINVQPRVGDSNPDSGANNTSSMGRPDLQNVINKVIQASMCDWLLSQLTQRYDFIIDIDPFNEWMIHQDHQSYRPYFHMGHGRQAEHRVFLMKPYRIHFARFFNNVMIQFRQNMLAIS